MRSSSGVGETFWKVGSRKAFCVCRGVTCGHRAGALDTVNSIVGSGAFIPQFACAYPGAGSCALSSPHFTILRKTFLFINPLPSSFDGETQNCRWDFKAMF